MGIALNAPDDADGVDLDLPAPGAGGRRDTPAAKSSEMEHIDPLVVKLSDCLCNDFFVVPKPNVQTTAPLIQVLRKRSCHRYSGMGALQKSLRH
jgi:hypothetical protein